MQVGILLMWAGYVVFIVGIIFVLLALTYVGRIKVDPDKGVIDCYLPGPSGRPSAIVMHDVQGLRQDVELSWKEQAGKEVTCAIQERAPQLLTGLYVDIFARKRGAEGSLSCTIPAGAYLITFESIDHGSRKVEYEVKATEYCKPYKESLPIGLTLLTIGTVLAVNGLTIFLRG